MPNTQWEAFQPTVPNTKPASVIVRSLVVPPLHLTVSFTPLLIRWLCVFLILDRTTGLSSLTHPQPKTQLQPHQHQYLDSAVIKDSNTTNADTRESIAAETNITGDPSFECNKTAIEIEKMSIPGLNEHDKKFIDRIQSSIQTVMTWEKDIELIRKCRDEIPWDTLADPTGPFSDPIKDNNLQGNLLFLQRLCRWFKSYMTWVNAPPCHVCGHEEVEFQVVRGPETDEEKEGAARRVEVYYCPKCKANTTTFPRYNSPKKLLETRKGRCGEYSNLFGLFCRSTGLETRLVLDLSDHLWTEVYIGEQDSWVMADGCEGVIAEPSMYEHGWGKKELCYMIGIAQDHILDVTPRYTRAYLSEDFQNRRRQQTSSEEISRQIFQQLNQTIQKSLPKFRLKTLEWQIQAEQAELQLLQQATKWTEQEIYGRGRISGSLEWKQARHEHGKAANCDTNTDNTGGDSGKEHVAGFQIQSFYPPILDEKLSLVVKPSPLNRHDAIMVADTPCAIGEEDTISVVVVDELYLGCILQSRSFRSWEEAQDFTNHIPPHRIVLCHGKCPNKSQLQKSTENVAEETRDESSGHIDMARLGGWKGEKVLNHGVVYVGQVDAHPDWSFCTTVDDCPKEGHEIVLQLNKAGNHGDEVKLFLKTETMTAPRRVRGRVPDSIMPLNTQLTASPEQKKMAFESFPQRHRYAGYTSKPNAPIYLLGSKAYPFQRLNPVSIGMSSDDVWSTSHYLPSPLVPKSDKEGSYSTSAIGLPSYEVPLDLNFFQSSVGTQLLAHGNTRLTISDALRNSRLIAFYFSAHWCGPCRSFTPMLAEMYEHLKEVRPTHGLEIIFVSSDRDLNSFQNYFGTMPWKAIPFETLPFVKQSLNATYGVRGIPSLVVLDAVSGRIVVSPNESRQAVATACQRGEDGIERMMESWLERVPPETAELLSMLQLSCQEDMLDNTTEDTEAREYLTSIENLKPTSFDPASRIKQMFETYTGEGMDPTQAAAKAIGEVAEEQKKRSGLNSGALYGKAIQIGPHSPNNQLDQAFLTLRCQNPHSVAIDALSTTLKYVRNAAKEPWTPKFRTFKLSNKIADSITRAEGGIEVLEGLGFDIFGTRQDFKATIPVAANLGVMENKLAELLLRMDVH